MRAGLASIAVGMALTASACGELPRDPDGTLQRVRATHVIRLGEVAGAPEDAAAKAALARVAAANGARIARRSGHGEELLEALEEGELDLVYGHFAEDSPWSAKVHIGKPPGSAEPPPKSQRAARFAFAMGENGWITAVEDAHK